MPYDHSYKNRWAIRREFQRRNEADLNNITQPPDEPQKDDWEPPYVPPVTRIRDQFTARMRISAWLREHKIKYDKIKAKYIGKRDDQTVVITILGIKPHVHVQELVDRAKLFGVVVLIEREDDW